MFSKVGNKFLKIQFIEDGYIKLTKIEKQFILDEDFLTIPYRCSRNVLTVGVGHTGKIENRNYSIKECLKFLQLDILQARIDYNKVFKGVDMNNVRKDALVNMVFNLGLGRFKKFKKMIGAIKEGNWKKASEEAEDSIWRKQTGYRAKRIVKEIETGERCV